MEANATIAVIGATGNMGSSISKGLSKGAYRLLLCANDQEKTQALINEIKSTRPAGEITAVDCSGKVDWQADVIILAVPFSAEKELAAHIKEAARQKIVVSIANPMNKTHDGLVTPPESSAAEELQKLLPDATVVKAFNTTFAADFTQPVIDGKQVDCFIAGNDEAALQTVAGLVKTIGFNPLIAGDLSVSGTLERMQLMLIQMGMKYNYNWLAGWKILHR
jgi:hypothetical protein